MCKCKKQEVIPFGLSYKEYMELPTAVFIENIGKYNFFVTGNLTKEMIKELNKKTKAIQELQAVASA